MKTTDHIRVLAVSALICVASGSAVFAAENPNRFNRLFTPPEKAVQSIKDDGIHDPQGPAVGVLQEPKQAFAPLEKSISGNYVDWTASLRKQQISPLFDYQDPAKKPQPMDLNIVMEVKGSTPDVVFPHNIHTELLDCSVCHPQVFVPQKGGNQISMAEIMLGQKCGICHGSVAFPVSDCKACHSSKPPAAGGKKAAKKAADKAPKK
ncbi:MAG: cytochrome c, class I [Gammaproteobacteria bacterium]|jgi:c(7)-type cytochrome triheme protein|nr:cytochrome c, class I [Gammaproteobacteria bacterium]